MNDRPGFVSDIDRLGKPRERPVLHLPEQVAGCALTVAVLTVLGPFSTSELPAASRAAYWALSIGPGWMLVVVIAIQTDRLFRPESGDAPIWVMLVNVGTIFVLVTGILFSRIRARLEPPAPLPARNAFLDRLPPQLGTALISLTAQDHYVEVTTAKGRALIHMRLSDAIEELDDYPGHQIHRSHWISGHAFAGTSRENGKLMAHLADGRTLPVSRSFAPQVRRMQPVRPVPVAES